MVDPKGTAGSTKVPLWLVPSTAIAAIAMALREGRDKYGLFNWRNRKSKVNASTYVSAALGHIEDWVDGEDFDPNCSDKHHLGAAMASLGIIMDAEACGTLNDDRPHNGPEWSVRDVD